MKSRMNIGTTSLILIFIVLCLSTFGLLSLSNARGDLNLAEKNAAAVRTYYEADAQGELFVQMVDQALRDTGGDQAGLQEKLGQYYQDGTAQTDIGMDFGQALHVELLLTGTDYRIKNWNVYNRTELEIDRSIPVWNGNTEE